MVTAHARLSTAAATLAPELTPVRVNVIAAGSVDTPVMRFELVEIRA